jgi:hypothetical protein
VITKPVDIVGVLEQLHGRVDDSVKAFYPNIVERVVVGYMAVTAACAPAGAVASPVQ